MELTPNSLNVRRKNMLFQWTKKRTIEKQDFVIEDLIATSESFPAELSLITEEKRLIKVAVCNRIIWKRQVIFSYFYFHSGKLEI